MIHHTSEQLQQVNEKSHPKKKDKVAYSYHYKVSSNRPPKLAPRLSAAYSSNNTRNRIPLRRTHNRRLHILLGNFPLFAWSRYSNFEK